MSNTSETPPLDAAASHAAAVALEGHGAATIRALLAIVVEIADTTHVWRFGDGHGGAVHQWMHEAADDRGMTSPAVPYRPPSQTPDFVLRRDVFERDAYRCRHCATWVDLTIDHIIPRSRGGTDDETNLQTLCRSCNSKKGDR